MGMAPEIARKVIFPWKYPNLNILLKHIQCNDLFKYTQVSNLYDYSDIAARMHCNSITMKIFKIAAVVRWKYIHMAGFLRKSRTQIVRPNTFASNLYITANMSLDISNRV